MSIQITAYLGLTVLLGAVFSYATSHYIDIKMHTAGGTFTKSVRGYSRFSFEVAAVIIGTAAGIYYLITNYLIGSVEDLSASWLVLAFIAGVVLEERFDERDHWKDDAHVFYKLDASAGQPKA